MKTLVLLSFILISHLAWSEEFDPSKVSKILRTKFFDVLKKTPAEMSPSCVNRASCNDYSTHVKTYTVNLPLETVWTGYTTMRPDEAWKGKSDFQLAYRPTTDTYYYKGDTFVPMLAEGDRIFLQLNLNAVMKIPAAFEIARINQNEKVFELSYLNENKSHGFQRLEFFAAGKQTLIKHTSRFSSGNKFRDEKLYPPIHENLCDKFHEQIKFYLENAGQTADN